MKKRSKKPPKDRRKRKPEVRSDSGAVEAPPVVSAGVGASNSPGALARSDLPAGSGATGGSDAPGGSGAADSSGPPLVYEKKDVFISYRRDRGAGIADRLYDRLTALGYSVFLDICEMHAGHFRDELEATIRACKDFVIILTPGALDRCVNEEDYIRWEVDIARKSTCRISPIVVDGFTFPDRIPASLSCLKELPENQLFTYSREYYGDFLEKLQKYALISRPRTGGTKSIEKYFQGGVFSLRQEEIDPGLLPQVRVGERVFRLEDRTSPLEQILESFPDYRFFLLEGSELTSVSGAGKTTSLRYLLYRSAPGKAAFVPLGRLYGRSGKSSALREWLKDSGQGTTLDGRLLLLDGLEEVTETEGIQALVSDLTMLQEDTTARVVISSRQDPSLLASSSRGLNNCSNLFRYHSLTCQLEPMTEQQRDACRLPVNRSLRSALTSPFLLRMCQDVESIFARQTVRSSLERWLTPEQLRTPMDSLEKLFYTRLAVQIVRWFDGNPGDDEQNEADAFYLLYALPAVAFHMKLPELYDQAYVPAVREVTSDRFAWLLEHSYPAFRQALDDVPAYREDLLDTLGDLGEGNGLDRERFVRGRASAILERKRGRGRTGPKYRVPDGVWDSLAALHLANTFCAAWRDDLEERESALEYFFCPACFLPRTMVDQAAGFVDQLLQGETTLNAILEEGPGAPGERSPFARWLLCSLGELFAVRRFRGRPELRLTWMEAGLQALDSFAAAHPAAGAAYDLDRVENLCAQGGIHRLQGNLVRAHETTLQAAEFLQGRDSLRNTDPLHYLGMVYFAQVQRILNQVPASGTASSLPLEISPEALRFAENLREELRSWPARSGSLLDGCPPENTALVPDLLPVLDLAARRLELGREKDFFHSGELAFLLQGSYFAKACCVLAVLRPGTSGAAVNLLAAFLEYQLEELENSPRLPFYQAHPDLWLDLSPESLRIPDGAVHAFRLASRICAIHRGVQPYSAATLARLLLSRQVRLSPGGLPVSGPGPELLTRPERDFLEDMTRRAAAGGNPGNGILRLRFLNERVEEETGAGFRPERDHLFWQEWARCGCEEQIRSGRPPDRNAFQLLCELPSAFPKGLSLEPDVLEGALRGYVEQELRAIREPRFRLGRRPMGAELAADLERLRAKPGALSDAIRGNAAVWEDLLARVRDQG